MIPQRVFEQTLLSFFAPVSRFLDDPSVTEVMINGPFEVYVERAGRLERTDARFDGAHALAAAVRNLAQYAGRYVSEDSPILEARMPDGSRVEAVLPPAAPHGPQVSIRRFFRQALSMEQLIGWGSLSADAGRVLAALVACRQNILVAGGTGSGKTSFLNVLSAFIDPAERIIVIEDACELQLVQPHVVQLESRPPDAEDRGQITARDLFRATLRMRPDRIVMGEIRGGEAIDLIQAMISGHGGCLSTVHATYPIDALNRLETMALMSDVNLPLAALRVQIASAIDFVVQTARLQDGSRCVTHVTEVVGHDPNDGYRLRDLFVRRWSGRDADGRVLSELVYTGEVPRCLEMMKALGIEPGLPERGS
ncbi:MAG TPA: CpaF family protein [Kofleriaceae bacterium]|nr:CpaF family protein [Kofleriaceae bacterium]